VVHSCADLLACASQRLRLKPGDKLTTEIEKLGRLEFDLGTRA